MKKGPTKGPRGVQRKNSELLYTPRRPELQVDLPEGRSLWWRMRRHHGVSLPPQPNLILFSSFST